MSTKDKELSFEKALERLEKIVQEMESGQLSLDKMMRYFEEGVALVKSCEEKLNEVEHKIEVLVKASGRITTAPFAETEPVSDQG